MSVNNATIYTYGQHCIRWDDNLTDLIIDNIPTEKLIKYAIINSTMRYCNFYLYCEVGEFNINMISTAYAFNILLH